MLSLSSFRIIGELQFGHWACPVFAICSTSVIKSKEHSDLQFEVWAVTIGTCSGCRLVINFEIPVLFEILLIKS